jgi:hypothetical protein
MRSGTSIGLRTLGPAACALALAACGGGSGGGEGGGGVGTASVKGVIVTRDGTTQDLAGVRITDARTGAWTVSGPTGAFDLGLVPAGTITLRVGDAVAAVLPLRADAEDDRGVAASTSDDSGDDLSDDRGDDSDDDSDDDGDDHDVGDDDMDIANVRDGDDVEVRLHVRDGVIESCDVSHSDDDDRESEARLQRSVESDDPDVEGKIRLESRVDRERIRLEAEHLTPGRVLEWFVIAPDGTEESQGTRTATSGEVEWEPSTSDGDRLPFGVSFVADLEGYGVEVRDATTGLVLLFGTIGAVPPSTDDDDDDGDESRGRSLLTPAAGVTGEAHVEVRSEPGDHDKIEFEIEDQMPPMTVEVWLEDPANLGTLTSIGSRSIDAEGEAELEFEAEDGETLPHGATSVSALVGLRVEFRNAADGAVLFFGTVPALVPEE